MLDQLSPVASARVRAVLLPIGQIKRARFLSFVERLQPENVVRLGDISPDGRPNRSERCPSRFRSNKARRDADHTRYVLPSSICNGNDRIRSHNLLPASLACCALPIRTLPRTSCYYCSGRWRGTGSCLISRKQEKSEWKWSTSAGA